MSLLAVIVPPNVLTVYMLYAYILLINAKYRDKTYLNLPDASVTQTH